jgi:zinc protease
VRRLLLAALGLGLAACATARPSPLGVSVAKGPEGPVTDGDVTFGRVGQVEVLVRRWPGAELVASTLAMRGGVLNVDARTAGAELLGLRTAASGGPASLSKDAYSRALSKLGGALEAGASPDYSALEAKSLRADWEATLRLLLDVFLHPALSGTELELQRARLLQELKREQESPDDALQFLSEQLLFSGTPYALRPQGTDASVRGLTAADVQAHLQVLRAQNRLLLVVVGDVEPEAVFALARQALLSLPEGGPPPPKPAPLTFAEPRLSAERRPLPTNYILASFAGPIWGSADFAAARLGVSVLSGREFLEVRSRRNLSYAPEVRLNMSRPQSFGGLYLSAVEPSVALPVMQTVVEELAKTSLPEEELKGDRAALLVEFFLTEETTDGAAQRLVEASVLGGDWHLVRSLPERVRHTTAQDVQAFVQKYVHHYQVAVVGNPDSVQLEMLRSSAPSPTPALTRRDGTGPRLCAGLWATGVTLAAAKNIGGPPSSVRRESRRPCPFHATRTQGSGF